MLHIKFKYQDKYTKPGYWSYCEGDFTSLQDALKWYGFDGTDPDCICYEVLSVSEKIKKL